MFSVSDLRPDRTQPLPEFEEFKPILDRLLVRRNETQALGDGFDSAIPEKYRQHSNWGTVVAIGDGVLLGGEFVQMSDFVNVGDLVKYGEYCAEQFDLNAPDLFIIRLQDVRGVKRLKREQERAKEPGAGTIYEGAYYNG